MLLSLMLLLQSTDLPTMAEVKFDECIAFAKQDPKSAVAQAGEWAQKDGGYLAQTCIATAYANEFRFEEAAPEFVKAALAAEGAKDRRAAQFWAQAGNAAIAADQPEAALTALDAALKWNSLSGAERGDVYIDRARALVAAGREKEALDDLAQARTLAPENAIGWLLSATLARRLDALGDAQSYIETAAVISPFESAIALEAGNIAATAGNYAVAERQWKQVIVMAPKSRFAETARAQLASLQPACTGTGCRADTNPAPQPQSR